ncbi:glycosyltransferase family 2 protein [Yeosuana sp. MJ-SS3]|jgi:cellulose synthase/poly-beta-1,6-N-acetylglucosamine synthase-like glycosyltransferase|uniref:Glycosyltransferase family 2 protein n=1 Tax=Gilvirhabdus luticola TaxID=3079858 RepID=A0ABU3U4A2_9FLAO|nr:glycosyltransferase family 2 protein [Yeosuana sp. MJ-SS3]MDU8885147.1 glycosyltransferase family 2 protein [Yeosuana sp. MJ-SS3]
MIVVEILVIIIYGLALLLIFLYALAQMSLLLNYLKSKKIPDTSEQFNFSNPDEIPLVTIQLPVYNEMYVMERLLNNISKIDYPKHKFEIQVLDDSTDESLETTANHIQQLQQIGLDIKHITRTNRIGFKSGALKEGLKTAKGEFIAIFDADFLPKKDWLLQTIPYFKNKKLGVVQTRWSHINRDYSLLTKVQAFALDAHFTLEQVGRNIQGHFMNFNGTAGVWRKECILDAGNWQADTLTEDLDLSYRAQLKHWDFKYLEHVETPAELPVVISAVRSQQFRWNKGASENFRKSFLKVIRSKNVSFKTKIHAFFHLLNSTMFLNMLVLAILSVPMLFIKQHEVYNLYMLGLGFFVLSSVMFFVFYWYMYKTIYGKGLKNFIGYIGMFFTFFTIIMGFSLHNGIAALEGHLGKRSDFIRTPKFNINTITDTYKGNKYLKTKTSYNTVFEGLLALYFGFGLYSAFTITQHGDFGFFALHFMAFLGFGYVFLRSLRLSV